MNGLEPSWTLIVVAVRLAAMMALLPGIGGGALPWRLRGVLVVALAAAAAPLIVASGIPLACGTPSWGQLGGQAFFGALVGGAIRAFVVALAMVGQWLSELSGLGIGAAAAWHADVEGGPLAQLFGWLALLVFLAIDGPYLAIAAVAETLAVPLPGASSAAELAQLAATVLDQSFELSLRVGSPILAALTVATIAVAAAQRTGSQAAFPGIQFGVNAAVLLLCVGLTVGLNLDHWGSRVAGWAERWAERLPAPSGIDGELVRPAAGGRHVLR